KNLLATGRGDPLWNDEIVPVEESTLAPPELDDVETAVAAAVRRRPELARMAGLREVTDVQKRLAADQTKPQVNLVAGYTNTGLAGSARAGDNPFSDSFGGLYERLNELSVKQGLAPLAPRGFGGLPGTLVGGYGTALSNLFGGGYRTLQAGVSLDLTLRNTAAEAALAQASIAERRLKLQQAQIAQGVAAQVRNTMQALQTARQRIAAAEAGTRAAREKLESETRLFQTGESTNFLVLTRQNDYADARHRLLVAKLDFNKAVSRLEQALGMTLRQHKIELK
ncbi:MAG: TolC family protein, partial [Acidobacteria bacterium]|nr:TolC family protein [Acidobacteriota bacterium]